MASRGEASNRTTQQLPTPRRGRKPPPPDTPPPQTPESDDNEFLALLHDQYGPSPMWNPRFDPQGRAYSSYVRLDRARHVEFGFEDDDTIHMVPPDVLGDEHKDGHSGKDPHPERMVPEFDVYPGYGPFQNRRYFVGDDDAARRTDRELVEAGIIMPRRMTGQEMCPVHGNLHGKCVVYEIPSNGTDPRVRSYEHWDVESLRKR